MAGGASLPRSPSGRSADPRSERATRLKRAKRADADPTERSQLEVAAVVAGAQLAAQLRRRVAGALRGFRIAGEGELQHLALAGAGGQKRAGLGREPIAQGRAGEALGFGHLVRRHFGRHFGAER